MPHNPKNKVKHYFNEHNNLALRILMSKLVLKDGLTSEERSYFGEKERVIDAIIYVAQKRYDLRSNIKKEMNSLFESIELDGMTRDIWFTVSSIEKIAKEHGWNEDGEIVKYPSANKTGIEKRLREMYGESKVEQRLAVLDGKGKIVRFVEEEGPEIKSVWRVGKEGIKFVLVVMTAKNLLDGNEQ